MITERIIITFIICISTISICFIITHYSNKECKQQKLNDIKDIVCNFSNFYIKVKENEYNFIGNANDIKNMIRTIKDLTY